MAVSKQPSITPETSSAEGLDEEPNSRGEAKWKRFHPFRVVRKIFRRRVKRQGTHEEAKASKKSWSTSELLSVQDPPEKYEIPSPPYKIGLSVSHDSIFSSESSNLVSSEELSRPQGSSLSVQHAGIKNMFKDELFSRVRARRDSDDDDIGLPHSPCTSPTTVDVLNQGLKAKSSKSQTTCSAGSLISMGSSENDEDSLGASSSGHSSKMSLLERRSIDFEGEPDLCQPVPLNHKAAHHKIAVRPKRTHGLPQKRLKQQLAASRLITLPATPEVTEDNGKLSFKSVTTSEVTFVSSSATFIHEVSEVVNSTLEENMLAQDIKASMSETSEGIICSHVQYEHEEHAEQKNFDDSAVEAVQSNINLRQAGFCGSDSFIQDMLTEDIETSSSAIVAEVNKIISNKDETTENERHQSVTDIWQENINKLDSNEIFDCKEISVENGISSLPGQVDEPEPRVAELPKSSSICVSALIKNIENSDSVSKRDSKLDSKRLSAKFESSSDLDSFNMVRSCNEKIISHQTSKDESTNQVSNRFLDGKILNKYLDSDSSPNSLSSNINRPSSTMSSDILAQNVQNSVRHSLEQNQIEMAIKQQFHQQKVSPEKDQTFSPVSSLFPDEESIMSNKYMSSAVNQSVANDSCVVISHQISDITEACNLVTVDKTFNMNIQRFSDKNRETVPALNEPYISSLDISSSGSDRNISNVTVNSTSNVFKQKVNEDKVTISINSTSEDTKLKCPEMLKKENSKHAALSPKMGDNSPEHSVASPVLLRNKKPIKQDVTKTTKLEKEVPVLHLKNTPEPSKRVSVEIVPFSQRMKDRKYQPLGVSAKEVASDKFKPVGSATVERNLSDRRSSPKGKDTEKNNNRHSFSGSLSADTAKPVSNVSDTDKPRAKSDKFHYPVQIRIHKNKNFENESEKPVAQKLKGAKVSEVLSDTKTNTQPAKEVKDRKKEDSQAKWEVKVQSTSLTRKEAKTSKGELKGASSDLSSKVIPTVMSQKVGESDKSFSETNQPSIFDKEATPPNSLTESAQLSRKENPRKSLRETSQSDDPEPELLRVFARRSIKQKHSDKAKPEEKENVSVEVPSSGNLCSVAPLEKTVKKHREPSPVEKPCISLIDSTEESENIMSDSLQKKSKSLSEKEKQRPNISMPLKEASSVIRRPSLKVAITEVAETDNYHRRQRLASEPDVTAIPPSIDNCASLRIQQTNTTTDKSISLSCRSEHLQRAASISISPSATLSNGTSSLVVDSLKGKENPDGSAPSWLQLAQQRRELREQRERLLLGSSTNSFLDASSKPSRSSKVWDMVNNFQKMQMT